MTNHKVKCSNFEIANNKPFTLIAGPCQLESESHAMKISNELKKITSGLGINLIYKTSFDKANRTSLKGKRGAGLDSSLPVFDKIKKELNIPVLTDVHNVEQCSIVSNHVDVLQIPAFLCRQTELLIAAAETGKMVNVKKGQFLSPESMKHVVNKIKENGNNAIMLTDRGTMFGYKDMVVDYRGIPIMKSFGVPVILDVTHSLQQPNQNNGVTAGKPEMINTIAKAGIAAGVDGIFLETHPDPSKAKSDGANMLKLNKLEDLLVKLVKIRKAII